MTREEYIEFANALKNNYTIDFDKLPEFCDMAISALSENKGKWIDNGTCTYMCSNCKTEWTTSQIEKMCFCPTCGADMRGVSE